MKITILGYWGGFPYKNEGTSSYLIESEGFSLLLDAGSGSLIQLEKKLDPLSLDAVILTHYHHDHIADLGVLQYYRQLMPVDQEVPILPIFGHTEDEYQFQSLTLNGVSKGYPYQEQDKLVIGPFDVTFLRTIHPVPCFAMRITETKTGKVFVFTADTGYKPELIPFAKEADLLVTDTYFLNGKEGHFAHLTAKETGLIAKEAQVKKVILSHLRQDIDLEKLKQQTIAEAGKEVLVELATLNLEINL